MTVKNEQNELLTKTPETPVFKRNSRYLFEPVISVKHYGMSPSILTQKTSTQSTLRMIKNSKNHNIILIADNIIAISSYL